MTRSNFNYTSAAIGTILGLSALSWCKAKYGFTGAAKEESRAAHRTTPTGSSASSMRRVSSGQYRQSQQRQRPPQSPLYLTPNSDSRYLGSNSSITVPTEPGQDDEASHHLKPSSQRSPKDEHHYGLPLTITTTSTFDPRGYDLDESHQGSGSSQHRHKSKRPGLSTTQTSYQSEYSSFRHGIPLYSSSEALSSPPASPSYRLPPWSENQHPVQGDSSAPDIVLTKPPMNTPNVPEISIAPPTTVSSHDSRTSRATSDIHISHDTDDMYHPRPHHHHHHHRDDRALSSPTSSPPTSSSFRPPNATESIFRDLSQSPGPRPHVGSSAALDSSGGGTKSGSMMVIHDDEHKEVLTKMPPVRTHPKRRRPPTPYPLSAANTSEQAPTTTADSSSGMEDSHRTRRSEDIDENNDDDDDDEHDDREDDNSNRNRNDDDDDEGDDMQQSLALSSPTRPELERRVAVYPILPYMKAHPPHSITHPNDNKQSKGPGASRTNKNLQQQQHDDDNNNDDDNHDNSRSKREGHLKEIDTTMDVDDSYDAEYHHQYPVVSAYQSSHDLFKLPATAAAAAPITTTTTTPASPPGDHDHDRASVSSLVRGGTSTDLYHDSLNDRSSRDQAVAKWAQDQARIHQRRMQKRQARAQALQELRKAHAAAVVTSSSSTAAGTAGEALEASVSDGLSPLRLRREMQVASGAAQDDQESQAQTTTATVPTTTAAAPLKVQPEENDDHHVHHDHHDKDDNGEEDVQTLTVQQEQGPPLEPIGRTETTGAGVGKPF
ncbi:hypothetical protein BGZ67_006189 [Mortierella alpina]|nr:hypothetical protein BGZ67_006189 [Mortierella alpina]